ncbi:hypothetical protein [Salinimicrobium gaetbulicola]|uniref:Thrombospondin type 3 repeat-containing protein n=1 Tax=Salinimicrobium gaetbulicola TaxID=999702 RepID=A0ABW3IDG9_9FLAO
MKKFKFFIAFMGVFALLFFACSKDENNVDPTDEKATLSFGAIVQDLANKSANKQTDLGDIPECTDDAPAYVHIVLMQGESEVVGALDSPFQVDLVAGQVFTKEVPELELEPGTYSLEHFSVYNSSGDLIWIAPKGGVMADFVDFPLPLSINLEAGVKKYVDVSVLCYDDRDVNQYGYLFFELDANKAFEFCFFANYCPPDGDGRHYTANYSVNIWLGTDNTGTPLYTSETPVTGQNNVGDYFAEPACFVLPANADLNEAYLYYEVTLLDWPGNYGTVAPNTVISGVLTAQDVIDNFDGEDKVNFEHLRFNCDDTPCPDGDGDGVCDNDDNCPAVPNPDQADNDQDGIGNVCDDTPDGDEPCAAKGGDSDGDGICDDDDNCPNDANQYQEDTDNDGIGNVCDDTPGGDNPCDARGGDSDGDGICDDDDNCPNTSNPDQDNRDADAWGDVCDLCPDQASEMNEECPEMGMGCDTAYMFGDQELNDDALGYNGNNWGWGLYVDGVGFEEDYFVGDNTWEFPFYAGAGQNDTSKGWQAGIVQLVLGDDGVTVQIILNDGVTIDGSHIWISEDGWPDKRAPGQFNYNYNAENSTKPHNYDVEAPFYLIVHGGVCN